MNKKIFSEIRSVFDFNFVPSLVFSDDCEDFLVAIINSKGQVLSDIMNDFFSAMLKEQGVETETSEFFFKEQIEVVSGKVDDDSLMIIVKMPEDYSNVATCAFYTFVYNVPKKHARMFTVANDDENTILCEYKDGEGSVDYGRITPQVRPIMEKILEILRN